MSRRESSEEIARLVRLTGKQLEKPGQIDVLSKQVNAAFLALMDGSEDGIVHHNELRRFLVDWKGEGEDEKVFTETDELDDFIYLTQNELDVSYDDHKDYFTRSLFFQCLSHRDFRSRRWPQIASRLYTSMDKEGKGSIGLDEFLTFFQRMDSSVERHEIKSLILDLKRDETKGTAEYSKYRNDYVDEDLLRVKQGSEFMRFMLRGVFGFKENDDEEEKEFETTTTNSTNASLSNE